MKSYDEIRHFKNLIDLSRITAPADDFTTSGRFEYDSDDEAIFRKAGWKCLIPRFDEFVIRMNKYRYLYVHITNLNKRTKSYTLHTECYVGTPDEWCLHYKMEYKIWFLDDNGCEVPAKYKVLTSEIRSTIVSNFINA